MPRASATRSQLVVLALIWLCGAGLWLAPAETAQTVRGVVRDALIPGQRGVQELSDGIASNWRDWRATIGGVDLAELEKLERDAAVWRHRALQLQVQSAELQRQLEVDSDLEGPFSVLSSEPLLETRLIEARILGSARSDLESRLQPIINRGATHDVDMDDLVLADDRLHLDQGSGGGLKQDNLVLSGVRFVGRIQDVGRWTSTIQPLTDEDFRGTAQLVRQGTDGPVFGAEGILAGNGDGSCRLELIDASAPVSVGDTVFLPAHRAGLPGSVYYGRVVEARLTEGAPYWSIQVAPHAVEEQAEHLQVLLEAPNPVRLADHASFSTLHGRRAQ